jgi:tRNA-binding EMAP/Myf-like protein
MLISPVIKRSTLLARSNILRTCQRFNHTEITNDDVIHRVDLRVGKIVHIEQHAEANHLFIEQGTLIVKYDAVTFIERYVSRFKHRSN